MVVSPAMAVGALGGVGIAQAVDLAVVGGFVGLVGILVAIAATGGDRQLGLVGRTADDVVGGVAVRADRRLEILLLGFPAVMVFVRDVSEDALVTSIEM